ncbi:hypothetical protein K9M79_07745 [Candidatus Woesearchaeota archaeon]|nr:hypothetical protein [Candidatus Woesearchaeota archaeon]
MNLDSDYVLPYFQGYMEKGILSALRASNSSYNTPEWTNFFENQIKEVLKLGQLANGAIQNRHNSGSAIIGEGSDTDTNLDGWLDREMRRDLSVFMRGNPIRDQIALFTETYGVEELKGNLLKSIPINSKSVDITPVSGKYFKIDDLLEGTGNAMGKNGPALEKTWAVCSAVVNPEGKPVMGIIYEVAQHRMFTAVEGAGAFMNGEKLNGPVMAMGNEKVILENSGKSQPKGFTMHELDKELSDVLREAGYEVGSIHNGNLSQVYVSTGQIPETHGIRQSMGISILPGADTQIYRPSYKRLVCNLQDHAAALAINLETPGIAVTDYAGNHVRFRPEVLVPFLMESKNTGVNKPTLLYMQGILVAPEEMSEPILEKISPKYMKEGLPQAADALRIYNTSSPEWDCLKKLHEQYMGSIAQNQKYAQK